MIWAIANIFVVYWFYTSAVEAGNKNPVMWAIVGGGVFLLVEVMWVNMMPVFSPQEINLDRDRSAGSMVFNVFMELGPAIAGIAIAGVVRVMFVTKEKLSFSSVFNFKYKKD